jgi:hypothetical protein
VDIYKFKFKIILSKYDFMDTSEAVLISQIPLGIACIIAAYELHKLRKEFEKIRKLKERR